MAGGAVRQAHPFIGRHFLVAIQTPAHVLTLLGLSYGHSGQVAVAGCTGYTGCDMRAVIKVNEIGLNGNRYPGDRLAGLNVCSQFIEFSRFFLDLLVASPTLGWARQPGNGSGGSTGVAISTLRAYADVKVMGKLNGLVRRDLSVVDSPNCAAQ